MNFNAEIEKLKKQQEEEERQKAPWKDELYKDNKGKIENRIENYLLYFNESENYKGKIKYNDFLQQKEFKDREWNDFDEDIAVNNIEKEIGLSNVTKVRTSLSEIFDANRYNPIKDYLNNLEWDEERRIDRIFIRCFNVDDTPLVRSLSKKWFIAAVKRVFEPGCQFDNMIVLQGPTGIGKTTFCRLLSNNFYSELKFDEIGNKDIVDKLNKSWIAIIDEMDNFGKKEMASIKSFLSVRKDLVRLAYGRNTNVYQRHCIFIGSLNDDTFLKDITTSVERRFWIFKCNREGMDTFVSDILTPDMVDQLWAEAMYYYKENPNRYLDVEIDMQKDFAEDQLKYKTYNNDVAIDYVNEILNKTYSLVNGQFNDDNDFLKQFKGENMYTGTKSYINKIKMSSVLYVLKDVYHVERSGKYIGSALSSEWEYKNWRWGTNTAMTLIRKTQNNDTELVEDDLPI